MASEDQYQSGWLKKSLEQWKDQNLCVRVFCSTCASGEFRCQFLQAVDAELLRRTMSSEPLTESRNHALEVLVEALSSLTDLDCMDYRPQIQGVFLLISRGSRLEYLVDVVMPKLEGCPAVNTLREVLSAYWAGVARRREVGKRSDTQRAALLRERQKQFRALKHGARTAIYKLRSERLSVYPLILDVPEGKELH